MFDDVYRFLIFSEVNVIGCIVMESRVMALSFESFKNKMMSSSLPTGLYNRFGMDARLVLHRKSFFSGVCTNHDQNHSSQHQLHFANC